jgi:hypothetical protein
MGRWVTAGPADLTFAIGKGINNSEHLVNNISNSLMVGFNATTPTLFVGGSNHRVGIGTSAPQAELDVSDMARVGGYTWPDSGAGMELAYNPSSHRGYIQVYDRGPGAPDDWGQLYLGNGEVGIGTADPGVKFQVAGGTDVDDETENSGYFIIGSSTGQHIAFDNNEIMSKTGGSTTSTLYFQNEGGIAYFGGLMQAPSLNVGSGTNVGISGTGFFIKQTSSKQYMQDIKEFAFEPDKIRLLRPVRFNWATDGKEDIGLIAEEVAMVMPDLVIHDAEGKPDAVDYDRLTLCLLEMVRRQQERISALEEKVETLQK